MQSHTPWMKIKVTHDAIREDLKNINQEAQRVSKIVSGCLPSPPA
jgi:hypothetical protein